MLSDEWIQGRRIRPQDVAEIRSLILENPSWHRTRISRELCQRWGWHNEAGCIKDMAARSLLLKLQAQGAIELPARQSASVNGFRNRKPAPIAYDDSALRAPLSALQPLKVELLSVSSSQAPLFRLLLHHHHYLSHQNCVGQNLKYMVYERQGRPIACLLFGSAAWKCRPRDAFIGWSEDLRRERLRFLTNNARFLVPPWVVVPSLASHVLSLVIRRLSHDWQSKYGHPIYAVETFVERERFAGTCYRAAGWIALGHTTGRGRNGLNGDPRVPIKDVLLRPLHPHFRRLLT